MARQRDFLTQIGITKKDRKEMAGCFTWLLPFILLTMLFF